ncbi:MAG TPA: radical SAM protein [bacterium]|uniref:Molybdenum cofactor biosynthesis protein A n=1 Tax=candidate division TA06 bacterium ADurb.Bin417 TaxID=1852828 RepID=A0A1V5MGW8_UNCT6|nr:MAG: molybdenum cofactor biosynthesis protein A [candidate division TA06 bacterium ADurb.Bin417]HNQ34784.1 radical SAM protein [bacterium]HNS48380.1 radical SAM protein [bacterium]
MKYLFGPVPSRRLGYSLGIDIVPAKTCTLNCVYCQLGPTPEVTLKRAPYLKTETLLAELSEFLKQPHRVDYLTFSGSGEPTLNSELGRMIRSAQKLTSKPVAVITNGTLLYLEEVRRDLAAADLVLPSLDAVTPEAFVRVNRPHQGLTVDLVIQGLRDFGREYRGEIWLEVMLVKGLNDSPEELEKLRETLRTLRVDRVQLNTVVRPPAEAEVRPLSREELESVARFLDCGAEIIVEFAREESAGFQADRQRVLETLRRRPLSRRDLVQLTGLHEHEVVKILEGLLAARLITGERTGDREYYRAEPES